MKSIYMLDLRRRINQNLNKTIETFGAFKSIEDARQWVVLNGKARALDREMKSGFYCVTQFGFGEGRYLDSGAAVESFDFYGNKVSIFK